MEFKIRKNQGARIYLDVQVIDGNTKIDLGLLDDKQRMELASTLTEAAADLLEGLETIGESTLV